MHTMRETKRILKEMIVTKLQILQLRIDFTDLKTFLRTRIKCFKAHE